MPRSRTGPSTPHCAPTCGLTPQAATGLVSDQAASATGDLLLDLSRDEWVTFATDHLPGYLNSCARWEVSVSSRHPPDHVGGPPLGIDVGTEAHRAPVRSICGRHGDYGG